MTELTTDLRCVNLSFQGITASPSLRLIEIDQAKIDKTGIKDIDCWLSLMASDHFPDKKDPLRVNNQITFAAGVSDAHQSLRYAMQEGFSLFDGFNHDAYTDREVIPITINFLIKDVIYKVNCWVMSLTNMSVTANKQDFMIVQNWMDYTCHKPGQTGDVIEMIGYAVSDHNKPCILNFETYNTSDNGRVWSGYKITFDRWLNVEGDDLNIFDHFNWKMSLLDSKALREILGSNKDLFPGFGIRPILTGYKQTEFAASTMSVSDSDVYGSRYCDYASVATLRNDTDAPLTMKSGDFEYTRTASTSCTISEQRKGTWAKKESSSLKGTFKLKIADLELGGETTEACEISSSYEYTVGASGTQTTTESWKYTCPGQSVVVPPKSSVDVIGTWKKTRINGVIKVTYPITDALLLDVTFKDPQKYNAVTKVVCELDIPAAEKVMGDILLKKETNGEGKQRYLVVRSVDFTSNTGSVFQYDIKPHTEET